MITNKFKYIKPLHSETKVLSIPPGEYGRKAETQIIRRPMETSSEACCL